MNKVTEVVAYIADGEDSFCSMSLGGITFSMVVARQNERLVAAMDKAAVEAAKAIGRTIRKIRFIQPEVLETFEP